MKLFVCGIAMLALGCNSRDAQWQPSHSNAAVQQPDRAQEQSPDRPNPRSHADAQRLARVLANARNALDRVYTRGVPHRFPNWIALHAMLLYGSHGYNKRDCNDDQLALFERLLISRSARDGLFVLRREKPWPRHSGPRFSQEHHRDQCLHIFSITGISLEANLMVDGREFQVRDLLEQSLLEVRPVGELAFTVSAYAHYLDVGRQWPNKFGEAISLAVLVKQLLETPEPACGGAHRLGGLARVLSRPELRQDAGMRALWPEIDKHINRHITFIKEHQYLDGGFPLPFETPAAFETMREQIPERFNVFYTGHTLEWLSILLRPDQLREEWVVRAVDRLADTVRSTSDATIVGLDLTGTEDSHFKFGQLAHAVSGLRRWCDAIDSPELQGEERAD